MCVGDHARIHAQDEPAAEKNYQERHACQHHNQLEVGPFRVFAVIRRGDMVLRIGFDVIAAHAHTMHAFSKKAAQSIA